LPRKNVLPLAGVPMLAYPVRAAQASGLFDRVLVSTEDAEIGATARAVGAEVLTRPDDLASDRATVVQVCLHALESLPEVREICCIYATAVRLTAETIRAAHALLNASPEADFVMGVSHYEHPPVQALKCDDSGFLSYMWPEWRGVQSQFHPRLVVSNGSLYWARAQAMRREKTFYGQRLRGYVVPADEVTDIDTPEDLRRVQRLFGQSA
jgi:pseudaminic acid cytidylyltransferase